MSAIKSQILMSSAWRRPSPIGITSSPVVVQVSASLGQCSFPSSLSNRYNNPYSSSSFSVSLKILSDSSNIEDADFVDVLYSKKNCVGSSHGWLGCVDPNNLSFYLFKPSLINDPIYLPFISLPPLKFLPDNHNAISKIILSSSPSPVHRRGASDDDINNNNNTSVLVVIILDWLEHLGPAAAFCRIGDPEWTTSANFPVESSKNIIFQDIAYYSKHNLFYVVTNSGEIYSWDLSSYQYCPMKQRMYCNFRYLIKQPSTPFPSKTFYAGEKEFVNCKYYLVMDESSGALMMVRLQIYYEGYAEYYPNGLEKKSYTHDVHRLDFDRLEWFPVKGLVDTAMIIGRNNGVLVDLRKVPGLMIPGYIYLACYADNFFQLTGLCISNVSGQYEQCSYGILRGDMTKEGDMTSFPVWNFE